MAEKEERIKIGYQSENLDVITEYTRQEAIERMAKAFCETGAPNTWGLVERDYKRFCLAGAEAALNALLSSGD